METRYKYPRTFHLPWSPGATSDDKIAEDTNLLRMAEVVITEKMDGECTTLYRDGLHARSLDSQPHESQTWVRNLHGRISHLIPNGIRICGENLFARHSILYTDLPTYFMVFSIWEGERCFSWDDTVELCDTLQLTTVPVLYRGILADVNPQSLITPSMEGYVVRTVDEFQMEDFCDHVLKYVRAGHVQTDKHWKTTKMVHNKLL